MSVSGDKVTQADMVPGGADGPAPFRRVLVTGAAGFIGYHLADRLLAGGVEVLGIDNLNGYYDAKLKRARLARLEGRAGFRFAPTDITDFTAMLEHLRAWRPDAVAHLAAQAGVRYSISHPRDYVTANIDGFLSVLEACRAVPVRHLLYASSSSVYGANSRVPFREDDPVAHPVSFYAATKRANELMAETYAHLYAIPTTGLRFFTVYGPWGRPDMAYFSFTEAIRAGKPIDLFNEGRMLRDFTFIDDAVDAVTGLLFRPPADRSEAPRRAGHEISNIGNHEPAELSRFVAAIEAALGKTAVKHLLPMQEGDVVATFADVERLRATLGYTPSTPIETGIRAFVEWHEAWVNADANAPV